MEIRVKCCVFKFSFSYRNIKMKQMKSTVFLITYMFSNNVLGTEIVGLQTGIMCFISEHTVNTGRP